MVVVVVGEESLGDNSISSSDFAVTPVEGEDKGADEHDIILKELPQVGSRCGGLKKTSWFDYKLILLGVGRPRV